MHFLHTFISELWLHLCGFIYVLYTLTITAQKICILVSEYFLLVLKVSK